MGSAVGGFEVAVTFLARLSLVLLFLPFSAFDKIANFRAATSQAARSGAPPALAKALIVAGLAVEVFMSAGVLSGVADRFCAFILAGYCAVTALLWKPFWREPDFRLVGESKGREVFWDFLKNFAVAGGFLMVTIGSNAGGVARFLEAPFASSRPYAIQSSAIQSPASRSSAHEERVPGLDGTGPALPRRAG